jgi:hypothetical protein
VVPSLLFPFRFLFLFLLLSFVTCPFSHLFYHYSRTGYEDKTAMRRLFFAYF